MTVYPNGTKSKPATSDHFGWRERHPVTGVRTFHYGWDNYGYTYNCAPDAGVVIFAQYNGTAGNHIQIRTDDNVTYGSMHNASFLASVGDRVAQGQPIGVQGTTGGSTGVHNHLEVIINGGYVDPEEWLDPRVATSSAGGDGTPIEQEEDLMELTRIILDNGPDNGGDFASSAIITPVTGFVQTSSGRGPRGALDAWTAIANALGFKVTESHVDANGWILAQLFKPVNGGNRVAEDQWAAAVKAALAGDIKGLNVKLDALSDDESKIIAAIRAIPATGGAIDLTALTALVKAIPAAVRADLKAAL